MKKKSIKTVFFILCFYNINVYSMVAPINGWVPGPSEVTIPYTTDPRFDSIKINTTQKMERETMISQLTVTGLKKNITVASGTDTFGQYNNPISFNNSKISKGFVTINLNPVTGSTPIPITLNMNLFSATTTGLAPLVTKATTPPNIRTVKHYAPIKIIKYNSKKG